MNHHMNVLALSACESSEAVQSSGVHRGTIRLSMRSGLSYHHMCGDLSQMPGISEGLVWIGVDRSTGALLSGRLRIWLYETNRREKSLLSVTTERLALIQLAGLAGREASWRTGPQQCHGFWSAVALPPSLFPWGRGWVICYGAVAWAKSAAIGPFAEPTAYAMVGHGSCGWPAVPGHRSTPACCCF